MIPLAAELGTNAPIVAENGGVIAQPMAMKDGPGEVLGDYWVRSAGITRTTILDVAHHLRTTAGYAFAGFADWSVGEIAACTGLNQEDAHRASQRLATEPILWDKHDTRWQAFCQALTPHQIRTLRGGRFIHLMGPADKADGLRSVIKLYQDRFPETQWTSVALGDSPNDQDMLLAADIAVVIPNAHGRSLEIDQPNTIRVEQAGPAGWDSGMQQLLDTYLSDQQGY